MSELIEDNKKIVDNEKYEYRNKLQSFKESNILISSLFPNLSLNQLRTCHSLFRWAKACEI